MGVGPYVYFPTGHGAVTWNGTAYTGRQLSLNFQQMTFLMNSKFTWGVFCSNGEIKFHGDYHEMGNPRSSVNIFLWAIFDMSIDVWRYLEEFLSVSSLLYACSFFFNPWSNSQQINIFYGLTVTSVFRFPWIIYLCLFVICLMKIYHLYYYIQTIQPVLSQSLKKIIDSSCHLCNRKKILCRCII